MTNPVNPFPIPNMTATDIDGIVPIQTIQTGWHTFQGIPQAAAQWSSPVSPTPQPSVQNMFIPMPGGYYFEEANYAQYFEQKRSVQISHQKAQREAAGIPVWTEDDEHGLVNKLHLQWFGDPWENPHAMQNEGELDVDKLVELPMRRRPVAPFKIEYQHPHELKLRLQNTIIAVKGNPFYVYKTMVGFGGIQWLGLTGADGKKQKVKYKDLPDLRSIPPMYVGQPYPGWLARFPGRVFQQGLNRNNCGIFTVDGRQMNYSLDVSRATQQIGKRENHLWSETISKLVKDGSLNTIRLSDDIAVHTVRNKVRACYCGRSLGTIEGNEVLLDDEDDKLQGWIEKAAAEVNLELRG